jgi:hypothetical protein
MRGIFGRTALAFLIAQCITVSSALAKEKQDVQQLLRQCTKPVATEEQVFCVAFISGVAEQMITNGFTLDRFTDNEVRREMLFLSACTKASFGAMVQAFVKWAESHPEQWGTPRQLGVMAALRETWPCK